MYQRKDRFYRQAKADGYRSRAAYKLLEIAPRYRLIRRGDHVVELGAWPGGWLQVAARLVGETGLVIGVDLKDIAPISGAVVSCVRGDACDARIQEEVVGRGRGRVDVVLCDMAPKLTGIRATDEVRAMELADGALRFAGLALRPGGNFLVKTFDNPSSRQFVAAVRGVFRRVKAVRPDATRKGSAEAYLVGLGMVPRGNQ